MQRGSDLVDMRAAGCSRLAVRCHGDGRATTHGHERSSERRRGSQAQCKRDHHEANSREASSSPARYRRVPWRKWRIRDARGAVELEAQLLVEPEVEVIVDVHI